MNKVLVGLVMVGSLAISGMAAEKSGAYAGVDLGVSMMKVKNTYTDAADATGSATALTYGLKGGYKHFLSDSFGVRGYVYLSNASSTPKLDFGVAKVNVKLSNMNYGVGADALYNFMDNFGAFAGISLGATSYSIAPEGDYSKATSTGFNAAVNLGVRTVLADMHGIELGVSVPVGSFTAEYIDPDTGAVVEKFKSNTQAEVKVSYVFNF